MTNASNPQSTFTPADDGRGWKALLSRVMPQPANDARNNAVDVLNQIRTPLAAMIDLSSRLTDSALSDEQMQIARTIEATNQHLLCVINDLLDAQRLRRGRIEVVEDTVVLQSVIDKLLLVVAGMAGARHLDIQHEVDMWVPGQLRGDAQRLLQVLTTLMGNAVNASKAGEVRLRIWLDDKQDTTPLLQFAVTDAGTPLHPELRHRAFEPVINSIEYVGHRPGLFVCRQVARAMGGDIEVSTSGAERTCFIFRLPLKRV